TACLTEAGGSPASVAGRRVPPLALFQSLPGGGIGFPASLTPRLAGVKLARREVLGVAIAAVGLVFLGISLAGATGEGDEGQWAGVLIWLGASGVLAGVAGRYGRRVARGAAAPGGAPRILLRAGGRGPQGPGRGRLP